MKNPDKHSVMLGSGVTSVNVSTEVWKRLDLIAADRGVTRADLIRAIDAHRRKKGLFNLSGILRKYVQTHGARKEVASRLAEGSVA